MKDIKTLYSTDTKGIPSRDGVVTDIHTRMATPDDPTRYVGKVMTHDDEGRANLALFLAAPKLHDLVQTMLSRMEAILADETTNVEGPVGDEVQDIINNAWEVLNEDGKLLGIAEYSE